MAIVALGAVLVLSACGQTMEERALSGAGLGAAGGAVGGALLGAPAEGALLGGAAGGAAGAFTDEDDIDLGEPLWDRF
jgi:hypothetical protein